MPSPATEARPATRPAAGPAQLASPAPVAPAVPEVQGAVLRSAAHLRVETPALGALELHLRIRDGAVHLRVTGDGASSVGARTAELSRTLAGEGLKLGRVDVPDATPGASADARSGRDPSQQAGAQGRQARDEASDARDRALGSHPHPQRPAPREAPDDPPRRRRGQHVDVDA